MWSGSFFTKSTKHTQASYSVFHDGRLVPTVYENNDSLMWKVQIRSNKLFDGILELLKTGI